MVAEKHEAAQTRWEGAAYHGYSRITGVAYDRAHDLLTVSFLNGETATLHGSALRDSSIATRWEQATVAEDGACLRVPTAPGRGDLGSGITDIPGFSIRLLTDAAFAVDIARKEEEGARRVGARLRQLRRGRNLTAKEVAARAGLAQQTITRIELGQHDVTFTVLKRILAVLGYTLADLHATEAPPQPPDQEALPAAKSTH